MELIGVKKNRKTIPRKKVIIIVIAICLAGSILNGCHREGNVEESSIVKEDNGGDRVIDDFKKKEEDSIEAMKKDEANEILDRMTLEEKIGQMFIVGFQGYEVNENIRDLILNKHVGGIILYSKNINTVEQTESLINELNKINNGNKAKLFISVDEEGGIVSRIPADMGIFEGAWDVGSRGDLNYAFEHGKAIGAALKKLGFNIDFAPVLDVNSNPNNPVIGIRAFSDNPYIVGDMAIEVYRGLKSQGIIAVGKHFPGNGDTSLDSHDRVPVINKSLKELQQLELIPFCSAISEGIPMIMTSHLLLPQLDNEQVASLSPTVIKDLLRKQLNFKGITITDDMIMGGITENHQVQEGVVKAMEAGQDIIILSEGYEEQIGAIDAVIEAVNSGRLSEKHIDDSVYRILSLKNEYLK